MQHIKILQDAQLSYGGTCQHCYPATVKATVMIEFYNPADKYFRSRKLRVPLCENHAKETLVGYEIDLAKWGMLNGR